MNFQEIFEEYYNQYRAEAETPGTDDDEYKIAIRLANSAIRRWASYDNTFWNNLYTTSLLNSTGGVVATTAGTRTYAAPTDMRLPGGYVKLINLDGTTNTNIPIKEVGETQFLGDDSKYAYFTGNPNSGYTLTLNSAPTETGLSIEYIYYKKPSLIPADTTLAAVATPDMSNPDFMVNHMLANRFRASRNPYYTTAKRDAENYLAQMKMENDSGTPANPWTVPDRSGSTWGGGEPNDMWSFG